MEAAHQASLAAKREARAAHYGWGPRGGPPDGMPLVESAIARWTPSPADIATAIARKKCALTPLGGRDEAVRFARRARGSGRHHGRARTRAMP